MNVGLYAYLARRWFLFAVIPALLVTLLGYFYTAREPKTYETSATLYVQQAASDGSVPGSTDIYQSQAVIPTYTQMMTSPIIAATVDREMQHDYPGYRLENHGGLKVSGAGTGPSGSTQANTQLMQVSVQDTNPARAARAANTAANAFIEYITAIQKSRFKGAEAVIQRQLNLAQANIQDVSHQITSYTGPASGLSNLRAQLAAYQSIYQTLLSSNQEFQVSRDTAVNAIKVFSPALVSSSPIGPHPMRQGLLFGFVALLLCVGGIFVYDYYDDTPKTPEDVEEVVGAPVLGTVQQFNPAQYGGQLVTARRSRSPLSEAYRVVRTNVQFLDVDRPVRSVVITSPSPSEGKSTTVSNLANVFAEAGKRVTLVDADLRRPSLHRIFKSDRQDGLTNMLASREQLNGHGTQPTEYQNLSLVASGPMPPRPADLLGSARMREFVSHAAEQSDLVLIDSPPILAVTDASILATVADGVILVVDPARSTRRDLRRAREAVEAVGGRILGVVINKLTKQGSTYYYYYYHHNYGYQYKYDYYTSAPREEAEA